MTSNDHNHFHHDFSNKFFVPQDCGYSEKAIRMAEKAVNFGRVENPDAAVENEGTCGEKLAISLSVDDHGMIDDIRFYTEGCMATRACGSAATILATHRSLDEAAAVAERDMLDFLEAFPADHHHCIMLAVSTLHDAVRLAAAKTRPGA